MRIRLLSFVVGMSVASQALGQDGKLLLPSGCSMVCAETYARSQLPSDTSGNPVVSKEEVARRVRSAYDKASNDNADLWAGGHALRYLGATVGDVDVIGAGPAAMAIEEGAAAMSGAYDELVAYAVTQAVDKEAASILRGSGRLDSARAKAVYDAINDPAVWSKMPEESRAALGAAKDGITVDFLEGIYSQGIENKQLIEDVGVDTKKIANQVSKIKTTVDKSLDTMRQLRSYADSQTQVLRGIQQDQKLWMDVTAQNLPAAQQLALIERNVITRSDKEIKALTNRATVDSINATTREISGGMQGLASGLSAIGLDKEAAAVNQGANLVSAVGSLAAGYLTGNPLMMAQGGLAAFGAISSFGKSSGPSAESKLLMAVLTQLADMRREIKAYHDEEMAALRDISKQIAVASEAMLAKQDDALYRLGTIQGGVSQLQLENVSQCNQLFTLMAKPTALGSRNLARVSLTRASDWFNSSGNQYFSGCRSGLENITTVPRPPLWPDISTSFLYDPNISPGSTGNPGDNSGIPEAEQVEMFVFRTLRPIPAYANNYLKPSLQNWTSAISSYDMSLRDIDKRMVFPAVTGDPLKVKALMPAGELLVSPGKTIHFASIVKDFAPIASMVSYPGGSVHMSTPTEIEQCAQTVSCQAWSNDIALNLLDHAEGALNISIAQEVILSGAPILSALADTLEKEVLPKYALERSQSGLTPLSDELAKVIPQGQSGSATWSNENGRKAAAVCETGNRTYDTLCLMQTNPWLADNVVSLLVYRQAMKRDDKAQALVDYRTALSSKDVNVVRPWFSDKARINDLARLMFEPSKRDAPLWSLELPRIDIPAYREVPSSTVAALPSSCWQLVTKQRLPLLKTYMGDARWARCVRSPTDVEPDRLLSARQDVVGEQTHYRQLLKAKEGLGDIRWALSSKDGKLSDDQIRLVEVAAVLSDQSQPAPVNNGGVP